MFVLDLPIFNLNDQTINTRGSNPQPPHLLEEDYRTTYRVWNRDSRQSSLAFQVLGEGFAVQQGVAGDGVPETHRGHDAADAGRFYRP